MSDPRREAYRILRRVEEGGAYASILLEERARSIADPRDVGLLTELVLGVLRRRAALDHAIGQTSSTRSIETIDPAVLAALRIGAYSLLLLDRVPDFAAVDTAVTLARDGGAKAAAGFVNGVLRAIARQAGFSQKSRSKRHKMFGAKPLVEHIKHRVHKTMIPCRDYQ